MNQVLKERLTHQLEMLPDGAIERVLKFITSLENRGNHGIPGSKLMKFAGAISPEDAELMMLQAVEQDCRRVDVDEW